MLVKFRKADMFTWTEFQGKTQTPDTIWWILYAEEKEWLKGQL